MLVAYIEKETGKKIAETSAIEIVESIAYFNEESQEYPDDCHIGDTIGDTDEREIHAPVWEGQWGDIMCRYRMNFQDFEVHFVKLKEEYPALAFTLPEMEIAWDEYLKQL